MLWTTLLFACQGTLCEGRAPSGATEQQHQLFILGYSDFDDGGVDGWAPTVVTDADAWDAAVSAIGSDPTGGVDLDTQVVFLHPWVDGGCQDPFTYEAWLLAGVLRLRTFPGDDDGCDAYFPQLDVVVVERGGAADVDFCD